MEEQKHVVADSTPCSSSSTTIPTFETVAEFEEYLIREYPDFVQEIRDKYLRPYSSDSRVQVSEYEEERVKLAKGKKRLEQIQRTMQRKKEIEILQGTCDSATLRPLAEMSPYADPSKMKKAKKTILDRLSNDEFQGPIALLTHCLKERLRIRVHIRGRKRLRSILTAYLVAFDSHWNLALRDVDELYYRSKKVAVWRKNRLPSPIEAYGSNQLIQPPTELAYHCVNNHHSRNIETMKRHLNQLFVRGDNVILVSVSDFNPISHTTTTTTVSKST